MECTFQVGDRVVGVRGREPACRACSAGGFRMTGNIYTVSKIWFFDGGQCRHGVPHPRGVAVCFTERPDRPNGFYAEYFRPVKPLSFWIGTEKLVEKETQE